jgi:hypothetical protein
MPGNVCIRAILKMFNDVCFRSVVDIAMLPSVEGSFESLLREVTIAFLWCAHSQLRYGAPVRNTLECSS